MKIRKGFVSNSSTSSFVIYGASFDKDIAINFFVEKLKEKYSTVDLFNEKFGADFTEDQFKNLSDDKEFIYEFFYNVFEEFFGDIQFSHKIDNYEDAIYIGLPINLLFDSKEYENLKISEIKDLVKKKINDLGLKPIKTSYFEICEYDS